MANCQFKLFEVDRILIEIDISEHNSSFLEKRSSKSSICNQSKNSDFENLEKSYRCCEMPILVRLPSTKGLNWQSATQGIIGAIAQW